MIWTIPTTLYYSLPLIPHLSYPIINTIYILNYIYIYIYLYCSNWLPVRFAVHGGYLGTDSVLGQERAWLLSGTRCTVSVISALSVAHKNMPSKHSRNPFDIPLSVFKKRMKGFKKMKVSNSKYECKLKLFLNSPKQ